MIGNHTTPSVDITRTSRIALPLWSLLLFPSLGLGCSDTASGDGTGTADGFQGGSAGNTSASGGTGGDSTAGNAGMGGSSGSNPLGGSGGTTDSNAGATSGGSAGSPEVPAGTVGLFVAMGHKGRTTISCDDGLTWVEEQSDDASYLCWSNDETDCDHDSGAGRGIAYGGGSFFVTFGWGAPGSVRRSEDGVLWTPIQEGFSHGGVAYAGDTFVAIGGDSVFSTDHGESLSPSGSLGLTTNVRRVGASPYDGGRFIVVGDDGELVVSTDGETWTTPPGLPAGCGVGIQTQGGIQSSEDTIVVLGGSGQSCASTDGGLNWTAGNVGTPVESHLVWDGTLFTVWSEDSRHQSADGITWTTDAIVTDGVLVGAVAVSDDGVFAAARGGWPAWYENQEFYRSTDGLTWEFLTPGTDFVAGHPIRSMTYGRGQPSASCPAD